MYRFSSSVSLCALVAVRCACVRARYLPLPVCLSVTLPPESSKFTAAKILVI